MRVVKKSFLLLSLPCKLKPLKLLMKKLLLVIILNFCGALLFSNPHFRIAKFGPKRISAQFHSSIHQFDAIKLADKSSDQVTFIYSSVNQTPIAKAGTDTTLTLPIDAVTLNGCSSSDPEMALLKYKWIKISGPGAYLLKGDSLCSAQVKGMIEGTYSFELTVTDTAGLSGKDTVVVTVNSSFSPNWPPQYIPLSNKPYKIVVIGSSTAYGTGASPIDSSWVRKFTSYLSQQNAQVSLINLAFPGYTSYHLSPTGTVIPPEFSFVTVDSLRNITKALSLSPDAIILNLPSNDIDNGFPFSEIENNYNRIKAAADSQHVSIWITTTQPRDLSTSKKLLQMELRDWIMNRFGKKAVDFWSTLSNSDGSINTYFAAGDGIHLNNAGHHVLFKRIVEEKIWDTICLFKNLCAVAKAGNDTTISGSPASITLDGTASFDPDGTIINFNWRILNDTAGIITGSNTANPIMSLLTPKDYLVELLLTDNLGAVSKDTMLIKVNPAATSIYTFTGNGNWDIASNWSNNIIPPAILSGNASIIIDPVNGECVLNVPQKITNGAILKIMEGKKMRLMGGCIIIK